MAKDGRKVSIELDAEGILSVQPMILQVKGGITQPVRFVAGSGVISFAVQFKGGLAPLNKAYFRSGDKGIKVRGDAQPGLYSYAVAVFDEKKKVQMDATCPGIIIDW